MAIVKGIERYCIRPFYKSLKTIVWAISRHRQCDNDSGSDNLVQWYRQLSQPPYKKKTSLNP